jgi:2'-hydroxyisoflavone reductase
MAAFLETCRAVAGSDARFTWVGEAFLAEHEVAPWTELPLWIPGVREPTSIDRALAAGLTFRPLEDTVRDTLAWQRGRAGQPLPEKAGVPMPDVTLKPERERKLLDEWRRHAGASGSA